MNIVRIFIFSILIALPGKHLSYTLEDSLQKKEILRMGFFDLNLGINWNRSWGESISNKSTFHERAVGLSLRMQSSFIDNYLTKSNRRIRFGDILAAEIAAGKIGPAGEDRWNVWLAYRFEFGFATVAKLTDESDIGLTLTLLKFARDRISPNVSGSNILLRYRRGRMMAEGGMEARRDRIFGWLTYFTTVSQFPLQYTITARYLFETEETYGVNLGLRFELANASSDYILGDLNYEGWWTLRLFYGIYF